MNILMFDSRVRPGVHTLYRPKSSELNATISGKRTQRCESAFYWAVAMPQTLLFLVNDPPLRLSLLLVLGRHCEGAYCRAALGQAFRVLV